MTDDPFAMLSGCHTGQFIYFFAGNPVKKSDDSSGKNNSEHSSKADADEKMSGAQADDKGDGYVDKIKNIFCKPHTLAGQFACHMHKTVAGVGDKLHIYGHGRPDPGTYNGKEQDHKLLANIFWRECEQNGKQIHKAGEYHAERNLQQIKPVSVFPSDDQL